MVRDTDLPVSRVREWADSWLVGRGNPGWFPPRVSGFSSVLRLARGREGEGSSSNALDVDPSPPGVLVVARDWLRGRAELCELLPRVSGFPPVLRLTMGREGVMGVAKDWLTGWREPGWSPPVGRAFRLPPY